MSKPEKTSEAVGAICRQWWSELAAVDPRTGKEIDGKRADRAELAQLRRIGTDDRTGGEYIDTSYAISIGGYKQLWRRLDPAARRVFRGGNADREFEEAVAVVAATLARVRTDTKPDVRVAKRLGLGKDGKPVADDESARVMSVMRFKHLIRTRDWPGLLDHGRRIVLLLERDVSVADLGASLLLWKARPSVIRDWSFAYYDAEFAAPSTDDEVVSL